jgi:hypothetical protein
MTYGPVRFRAHFPPRFRGAGSVPGQSSAPSLSEKATPPLQPCMAVEESGTQLRRGTVSRRAAPGPPRGTALRWRCLRPLSTSLEVPCARGPRGPRGCRVGFNGPSAPLVTRHHDGEMAFALVTGCPGDRDAGPAGPGRSPLRAPIHGTLSRGGPGAEEGANRFAAGNRTAYSAPLPVLTHVICARRVRLPALALRPGMAGPRSLYSSGRRREGLAPYLALRSARCARSASSNAGSARLD